MSRKDVIIVACLLNIALFLVLFATASMWEEAEEAACDTPLPLFVAQEAPPLITPPPAPIVEKKAPLDEIDEAVQQYTRRQEVAVKPEVKITKEVIEEVIVKKGDVLSKIAKAHDVTVEDIIQVNGLVNTKLKIGQVLKIKKVVTEQQKSQPSVVPEEVKGASYYVVQGGDNPWKIARKCKLDYDELLRLNNLDEEKAKNLKIGQKLRIK